MPSIHEELRALTSPRKCALCTFLDGLDPFTAEAWRHELAAPYTEIGHTAVVRALASRNVAISEKTVRRHREQLHV